MYIGDRLNKVLKEKKISQSDLYRMTDIKRQNISRYSRNEMSISVENLVKISKALNVSTDYLLGLSDYKDRR